MFRTRRLPQIVILLLLFLSVTLLTLTQYAPLLPLANSTVLINEVDAETPGTDTAEFVELYDGGGGHTSLNGLVIVFFNGQDDTSYRTFDLSGYQTSADGYFLLANESVPGVDLTFPDNVLQNGPDAVALYLGQASDFPNGTAVTTTNLQDAVVYDSDDPDDTGLLILLQPGESQVDENGLDLADFHSNQRCPNGAGGLRQTASYTQGIPTPKSANDCPASADDAPQVESTSPTADAANVSTNTNITITFSEDVTVSSSWYTIDCAVSGTHAAAVNGDGTIFTLNPTVNFAYGESCSITLLAEFIADVDTQDPPDQMDEDYGWSFSIEDSPVTNQIMINEIDADTPGTDTAEFIELYDGGTGSTSLDGLVVVLFNGNGDVSYRAVDLDGKQSNAQGYFVIGSAAVRNVDLVIPDGAIQNGADAIAIFQGSSSDFPAGTGITTVNLLDAIVYDTDDADDSGLLTLHNPEQPQVNEASRENAALDSSQRCPNGSGGQRDTTAYLQNLPTPGAANKCTFDSPPHVVSTWPADGQQNIEQNISLAVTFSEAVQLSTEAFTLTCSASGAHSISKSGGPIQFTLKPDSDLAAGELCTAKVLASEISDQDSDDPPDGMVQDYVWSFSVKTLPVATHMLINEVDADSPGTDTAEFVELFDGGGGRTKLDGLVVVLFNGYGDTSYRAIDLDGYTCDGSGYFVIGSSEVAGADLILPDGIIQNGADAVALYAADSGDFPNGSPVIQNGLLDALVYDTNDDDDAGLLVLLNAGQPQVNEAARDHKDLDSNQRCPNGDGGQRNSSGYVQNPATPGAANECTVDSPPSVAETTPSNGDSDIALDADLTVRFSEEVQVDGDWFEINCSQSQDHSAVQTGGPGLYTLDPQVNFESGESCAATLFAEQITDLDGLPQPMANNYTWTFATGASLFGDCGDPATLIHDIQGSEQTSPLAGTQGVIVEGLVNAVFQGNEALDGFFMQEESDDYDGNPQTSEGIFIHDAGAWENVNSGDTLRVQGTVAEMDGQTSLTRLSALRSCDFGATLSQVPVTLPVPSLLTWERVEGMYISLPQRFRVTGSSELGREGVVDLASEDRLFVPTETADPGETALTLANLNKRSRIKLDDGSSQPTPWPLPPYLGLDNSLRIGDSLEGVAGILSETAGGYRVQPTEPVIFSRVNARSPLPTPTEGALRAALFDTGDYFNGDGQGSGFPGARGAASSEEFERQRLKIINAILAMNADVIGLLSLENDGYGPDSALQDLVNGLNEAVPLGTTYAFVDPGLPILGSSEIAAGLIYKSGVVFPLGSAVTISSPPFDEANIMPLFQAFASAEDGETFVLAIAHFHDREPCPAQGDANGDQNDGQDCWNARRVSAASTMAGFLETDPTNSEDADVLILGNLNAYTHEDPLVTLETAGYINLAGHFTSNGYTTVVNGETGTAIHALASPNLAAQIRSLHQWHINADEPTALDYKLSNPPSLYTPDPHRSAEHDPLLVDIFLAPGRHDFGKIFLPVFIAPAPQESSQHTLKYVAR